MYKKERYIITYIKFGTMNSKSHVSYFIKKKMDSTSVLVKTHVTCETFNMYFVDKLMYHVARFMYVTHFIIRFVRNQD